MATSYYGRPVKFRRYIHPTFEGSGPDLKMLSPGGYEEEYNGEGTLLHITPGCDLLIEEPDGSLHVLHHTRVRMQTNAWNFATPPINPY